MLSERQMATVSIQNNLYSLLYIERINTALEFFTHAANVL